MKDIRSQFFPMELPSGVIGRRVERETAQIARKALGARIFLPREEMGYFVAPETRREALDRLEKLHADSAPEWIVFYSAGDEPVGWCYGYMEDAETLFIDTVGLIPAFRNRGIYTAFLKQFIAYLGAMGYERLTTSHHPNNRAIMIAELKAGFNIAGIELHESCGPLIKMAYIFHDDRREWFRQIFSLAPDQTSDVG